MNKENLYELIESLDLEEKIEYDSIPNLDLYMDQVITLFEDKLGHTKRYEEDKLLTKTMINNYIKEKLLMPAVKKKYTKEHVILMILLYELKQILTISDIKDLFTAIINEEKTDVHILKEIYEIYLGFKSISVEAFNKEVSEINKYIDEKISENLISEDPCETEKISSMLHAILLVAKSDYYKRLAEKIIDSNLKNEKRK